MLRAVAEYGAALAAPAGQHGRNFFEKTKKPLIDFGNQHLPEAIEGFCMCFCLFFDPHIILFIILVMNISVVGQHGAKRGGIVFVDPKIDFFFGDNGACSFEGLPQAFFVIAAAACKGKDGYKLFYPFRAVVSLSGKLTVIPSTPQARA